MVNTIHFNNNDTFEDILSTGEILDTDVVFIKETDTIYTHGNKYEFINGGNLSINAPEGYTYFSTAEGRIGKDSNGDIIFIKE